ncbi:hypothetical protein JCM11641_000033 [Rhodosporidiobolus odoratus]
MSPSTSPPRRQSSDRDRSSPRTSSSSHPTTSSGHSRTASTRSTTSPELEGCAEFPAPAVESVSTRVSRSGSRETSAPRAQAASGDASLEDTAICASNTTSAEAPDLSASRSSPSSSLPTPRNLSNPPNQLKSDSPIFAEILALPPDNMLHIIANDREYQAKADKWTPLFSLAVYESLVERSPLQKRAKTEHLFSGELMSYWDAVEGSVVDQLWTDYLAWEHANGIEDEARIRARLGRFPRGDFPTLLQRNQAEREALWEQAGEKR